MTPPPTACRITLLLAGAFMAATASSSQVVSARAVVAAPNRSTRLSGLTERVDGYWAGAALELAAERLSLGVAGVRGRLTATDAGTIPRQDAGEMVVHGRYDVRPWLGLEVRYSARAFSSAAGYQRWDIAGVGAVVSRDLGTPQVRGFASLAYLPIVRVRDQQGPSFAMASSAGISLAPNRFPLVVMLSYQVERFRFPATAARSEQFDALTLSAGVRATRRNGRWMLGGSN